MFSMTGYGKGEYSQNGIQLTVEIKTVNNRYLDLSIKSPKAFSACDEIIRNLAREKLSRGHADIFVNFTDKREKNKSVSVDVAAAQAYCQAAESLKERFALADDFTLTALMKCPDVIKSDETGGADDELIAALKQATEQALCRLNEMRAAEGAKLKADLLSRCEVIDGYVTAIQERAPLIVKAYRTKLEGRVKEYLDGVAIDEGRLLNEVALYADKTNVDEELTRLRSHIAQFKDICRLDLVGRKLDFLVQEFNREANTICSKSNDLELTRVALELKCEIEKVREQIQNLE